MISRDTKTKASLIPTDCVMLPQIFHCHLKIMTFKLPPLTFLSLKVPRRSRQHLILSMFPSHMKKKSTSFLILNLLIVIQKIHFHLCQKKTHLQMTTKQKPTNLPILILLISILNQSENKHQFLLNTVTLESRASTKLQFKEMQLNTRPLIRQAMNITS